MLVLGLGGRLAMRGITLWENRARQFTVDGTLRIMGFGALFGIVAATLRIAIDALARRFWPQRPERWNTAVFALSCLALGVIGLTPLTIHRLVLFPPVIIIYVLVFESLFRRPYPLSGA